MPTAAEQANTTVQEVRRELAREGGSQQAATLLMTEVEAERTRMNSGEVSIVDFNTYITTLLTGLENDLPNLSVGWVANQSGRNQFTTVDNSITGTGEALVNTDVLNYLSASTSDPVQAALADSFLQRINSIDGVGRNGYQDGQVSFAEVNQFLDDQQGRIDNLTYARLFSSASGRTLLNALDTRGDGLLSVFTDDDKFDRDNLGALINDFRNNNSDIEPIMQNLMHDTSMSRDQVIDTLQSLYDDWDTPQVQLMRDGGCMTLNSIANGAGYNSMADCSAALNCVNTDLIVPPSVANNPINSADGDIDPIDTGSSRLTLNSQHKAISIEYNNLSRNPATIQWSTDGTTPIRIDTGDGYVLSLNQSTNPPSWEETHIIPGNNTPVIVPINAPTVNSNTGEIAYSYTSGGAASITYQPDGTRLQTDASGDRQVITQPVVQATTDATANSVQTTGGSYDTAHQSFGDAATALAAARPGGLSTDAATARRQIQNAKVDLLILGYQQNVTDATPEERAQVVAALNQLRDDNGIGEYVNYGNSRISIYRMLRGTISY